MSCISKLPLRYQIECSLGKGGTGEVLKVHDSLLNRSLALKILSGSDTRSKRILIREFKFLSKLRHPNLVQVYDFGFISNKSPYFTMELLEGINLEKFFKNDSNLTLVPFLIKQVLSALSYLNNKGTLHGDIKPENIMVITDNAGTIVTKLLDFGLAIMLTRKPNSISGTLRFLAPEILGGAKYSPASDLYAFGLSLIECITNREAPIATHITEYFYRSTYSLLNNNLLTAKVKNPVSVSAFIINLVHLNQEERPQSAKEALQSFELMSNDLYLKPKLITENVFIANKLEINKIESFLKWDNPNEKVLILEGPRGIGKKSLINKAIHMAQLDGYLVLDLSNDIFIHNSLSKFIESFSNNLVEEQRNSMLLKHKKILSSLHGMKEHSPNSLKEDESLVIYDNIVQFVHKLSQNQPILLCIPDIYRFGEGFLRFIHHLAYETEILRSKILLIISRNIDIQLRKKKLMLYCKIISFSTVIDVMPFDENNLRILLKEYFSHELLSANERKDMICRTQGIPIFIIELIRHLIYHEVIHWEEGRWHFDRRAYRNTYMPEKKEDIVNSLLDTLTNQEKLLLQILALWEDAISPKKVSNLTNSNLKDTRNNIIVLSNKGIIKTNADGNIYFNKSFYRQFIINNTSSYTRRNISRLIAKTLEAEDNKDYYRLAKLFIGSRIIDKSVKYGFMSVNQMLSRYELYDSLALLSDLRKLIIKNGNKQQLRSLLSQIAPIEYKTGLTKKAVDDYITLIDLTNNANKKAKYYKHIAFIHNNNWGQVKKPKKLYYKALEFAKKANDIDLVAEILIELGELLAEKRLETVNKAMFLVKYRNINVYAKALSSLLYIYKVSGDIQNMEIALNELNSILDKTDIEIQKYMLSKIATIYFYKGDYVKSKNCITKKIELEEQTQDGLRKIDSLRFLGGIYYVEGKFFETINILKNALTLTKYYNDYLGSLSIIANLSLAYRHLSEYGEILKVVKYGNEIIKKYKIRQISTVYLNNLIFINLIYGNATEDEYRRCIKRHLHTSLRYRNLISLGHNHLYKSKYYHQRMKHGLALKHAFKALNLFTDSEDKDDIVDAHCCISIYFKEQGKTEKIAEHIKTAKNIYNEIHCEYLKPLLLYAEAALFRIKGDKKVKNTLEKALSASKKIGTLETTWQIQRELALYYKDIGFLHKALYYYKDSIETIKQITESIDGEELKISYLSVPFRKRVFEEIKLLKKELSQTC